MSAQIDNLIAQVISTVATESAAITALNNNAAAQKAAVDAAVEAALSEVQAQTDALTVSQKALQATLAPAV